MPTAIYVDTKGIIRAWINAQTSLVGPGMPLPLGAHLKLLRSPFAGAYALVGIVGGTDTLLAEGCHRARVTVSLFGLSQEGAARAAVAYANQLRALRGGNTAMTGAVCLTIGDITGPLDVTPPGDEAAQYLVDADFYFLPA